MEIAAEDSLDVSLWQTLVERGSLWDDATLSHLEALVDGAELLARSILL